MRRIIFASKNKGKIDEIRNLLKPLGFDIVSLLDLNYVPDILETGKTFFENSLIKAKTIGDVFNVLTLSDDSGLEVTSLNDEPGVESANYARFRATDKENNDLLIKNLKDNKQRDARYICILCLYFPGGKHKFFEGTVKGMIIDEAKGENGFGYDPHFYVPDYSKTMAELSLEEKNKISHRNNALTKLLNFLKEDKDDFR